jgi:hypothetical protein
MSSEASVVINSMSRDDEARFAADSLVNGVVGAGLGEVDVLRLDDGTAASIRPRSAADVAHLVALVTRLHGRLAITRRVKPGLVALDLSAMSDVDPPDERSCLIRAGAGALVRDVEANAIQLGLSLGPLLPSSPRKTVGAWLAGPTRGERAVPTGRLETSALALQAILADGTTYQSREAPRSATGPDLDHLLLGGEGRFGIITRATLRLFPRALVEASAARSVSSALEAIETMREATRGESAPVETRWDRRSGLVEARFSGLGAAARARKFGEEHLASRELIRGHLELAGSWNAWRALSPLRPQALQLVSLHADGAFGALEFEHVDEADEAAAYAQAMGFAVVSPRRLRASPSVGWSGAGPLLEALATAADPHGVFKRDVTRSR